MPWQYQNRERPRREVFITGPGPASGGSKSGQVRCAQMPEKSGIDAVPTEGALVCPHAGTAVAATNTTNERVCRGIAMPASLHGSPVLVGCAQRYRKIENSALRSPKIVRRECRVNKGRTSRMTAIYAARFAVRRDKLDVFLLQLGKRRS